MHIIAQPTTKYRVEERTFDAYTGTTDNLLANPDLLANPTADTRGVLNATDRDAGLDLFRAQLARNPGKYQSGSGHRLVLKGSDR